MRNFYRLLMFAVLAAAVVGLSGCKASLMWSGNDYPGRFEASYRYFSGSETKSIHADSGKVISITYQSAVTKGNLSMKVYDPNGEQVLDLKPGNKGTEEIKVTDGGNYKLVITGSKTSGSFDIRWKVK